MSEDITKESLISLVNRLTEIDNQLGLFLVKIDRLNNEIDLMKIEYNKIVSEIHRRFPPLKNDTNLQPKTLGKKRK